MAWVDQDYDIYFRDTFVIFDKDGDGTIDTKVSVYYI